ncbi:NAD-dependent epimerase/dehydratase family protein [Iamia majanohamensis]|uniref:NAD-dependent epimerase/dehydratase family protein n=1 Tax=Iamia majanohamensis TaxID=467976 RepID=A0AAE9Y5I9_9ACTN|nr:NAD-dependent epimerase/dehydratase family protein [Iamia majanohamensis]WCO66807.1 NAD-dependent epimerase/dehydratase family protein [Iamia majanohamensis]
MRVAITGATGFVGAHTTAAVLAAGHEVRALVRDRGRLERVVDDLGVDPPDAVVGAMTDAGAVTELLDGCDAVVHAAAVVSLDRRDATRMRADNPVGVATVVGRAAELGLDPIVHVSSTSALFRPGVGPLHGDLPVAPATDPYARSKAAAEVEARRIQDEGAPVVITYPSGILGPGAGGALGATSTALATFVRTGVVPTREAALSIVDVRDLAALHVRLLAPGAGTPRVVVGGHLVTMAALARALSDLTGRRFTVLPTPPAVLVGAGRALDAGRRLVPVPGPLTEEGMALITRWEGTDDSTATALGLTPRPLLETLEVSLRAWAAAGLVRPSRLGAIADPAPSAP